jgi:hypothetical protein
MSRNHNEDSYNNNDYDDDFQNDIDDEATSTAEVDIDDISESDYDALPEEFKSVDASDLDDIPAHLRSVASNKGKYYLTNEDLLPEVIKSREVGYITDRLARMLMLLTERYSRKANFVGYSYREDMVGAALLNLCKNALKFNPERSQNPFAFYTTAIFRSFLQYMEGEKAEHFIRDTMLIDHGQEASANYNDNIIKRRLDRRRAKNPSKRELKRQAEVSQLSFAENILQYE